MTKDPEPESDLVQVLERFLREAVEALGQDVTANGPQQQSAQTYAESLAALPSCAEADATASQAAAANSYFVSEDFTRKTAEPAGRRLNAGAFIETGIAAMLLDRAEVDLKVVAKDLSSYLAGPPIDIWDYAILDASLTTDKPIAVA